MQPVLWRPRFLVAATAVAALTVGLIAVQGDIPAGAAVADVTADKLEVNAGSDPLGLDDAKPTFSWLLSTDSRGVAQTKYQVVVASTAAKAAAGQGDVWDSGVIESDSTSVDYAGPALESRTKYYWSVKSWVPTGTEWAEAASFETAYLDDAEWQGDWITGPTRPIAPLAAADGTADDAGLLPSTTLTAAAPAGATSVRVASVAGATVGAQMLIETEVVEITGVGTADFKTTTAAPSAVGDTRLYFGSVTGLVAGAEITVGVESLTVTEVGTAAQAARTLAAAAVASDTVIKVNNVGGFAVGQKAVVGDGATAVVRTVTAVGM